MIANATATFGVAMYFVVIATLTIVWFWLGEKWLERRDRKRDEQAIADLVERETVERSRSAARPLRLVENHSSCQVIDARERFLARRTPYHPSSAA